MIRIFPVALPLLAALATFSPLIAQTTIDYADNSDHLGVLDTTAPNDPTILHNLGSGSAVQSGVITGTGGIIKTGSGSITLAGSFDAGGNTYTGGTTINEGTLRLANGTFLGPIDGPGTLTFNGGALGNAEVDDFNYVGNNVVATQDFALDVRGENGLIEFDANVDLGAAPTRTITLTGLGEACFGGSISGQNIDFVTTAGTSRVMFCNETSNTFTGTMRIGNGVTLETLKSATVDQPNPIAISGDLLVDAGGKIIFSAKDAQVATTSNVTINGAAEFYATGGTTTFHTLSGTGTVNSLNGENTVEVHSGTFAGSLTETNPGTLKLSKKTAGTLKLTGTNVISGGTMIDGGKLVVDGSLTGAPIIVNATGILAGSGTVGAVTIKVGGTISAGSDGATGTLSTGTETWELGGAYEWTMTDAMGPKGTGTDWLDIDGDLVLTATTGNPFIIKIISLISGSTPGLAANFDPFADQSWVLTTTTGAITGFDPDHFSIDTTQFANQPNSSRFSLSLAGNDLVLSYVAVPEPGAAGVVVGMALLVSIIRRRFRRAGDDD